MNFSKFRDFNIQNRKTEVLSFITLFIIIFILLFSIILILSNTTETFIVTDSMFPTFEGYQTNKISGPFKGELLIAYKEKPSLGNIIIFSTPQNNFLVVHRIVFEKKVDGKTYYLTKGDNNLETDLGLSSTNLGWISQDQVLGVVIFGLPNLGTFINFLQEYNFSVIIFGLLGISITYEIGSYLYKKRKQGTNHIKQTSADAKVKTNNKTKSKLKAYLIIIIIGLSLITSISLFYLSGSSDFTISNQSMNTFPTKINLNTDTNSEAYTINNITYHFLDFKITFLSHGFFDSVRELLVQQNITSHFFKWTAVKDLAGYNTINGLLIIPLNFNGTITDKITISGSTASFLPFINEKLPQHIYYLKLSYSMSV